MKQIQNEWRTALAWVPDLSHHAAASHPYPRPPNPKTPGKAGSGKSHPRSQALFLGREKSLGTRINESYGWKETYLMKRASWTNRLLPGENPFDEKLLLVERWTKSNLHILCQLGILVASNAKENNQTNKQSTNKLPCEQNLFPMEKRTAARVPKGKRLCSQGTNKQASECDRVKGGERPGTGDVHCLTLPVSPVATPFGSAVTAP